ncbi:MAG: DJ-1/PfpI family protein [Thermoanaerobaculales bacterium]|nr:DJ-1/PfpI family protein [Thermoanaerobaculales bacterium]
MRKPPVAAMVLSTVGYHWEEVFGAWDELRKAGWEVRLYTVDGSPPRPDPMSLRRTGPLSWLGLGVAASDSPESPRGRGLAAALEEVRPLVELGPGEVDALYLPGGHGCLFDVNRNPELHAVIGELYGAGRPLAAVCHATSTFAFVEADGRPIVAGKGLTGFPEIVDALIAPTPLVARDFLPIPFSNDRALADAGADLRWYHKLLAAVNPRYVRVDPPFVTGMGPKAARRVARTLIHGLDTRRTDPS